MTRARHDNIRARDRMRDRGSQSATGQDLKPWQVDRELRTGANTAKQRPHDLDRVSTLEGLATLRHAGRRTPGIVWTAEEYSAAYGAP